MNKIPKILTAASGVLLATSLTSQAQITYNNLDLLLDFRNFTTQTEPNVTVDFGNVNTFVSTVSSMGGTVALDTSSGFTSSFSTISGAFSYDGLTSLLGAPSTGNAIGFSAAAADSTDGTGLLYLTRTQSGLTQPTHPSFQQNLTIQAATAKAIGLIGSEAAGLNNDTTTLSGSGANAVSYSSGDTQSYQSQGQASGAPNTINYGSSQNIGNGAGGAIESQATGSANVYEALWEVPVSGTGSDTYEGYFTFQPDGEIDFTTPTAVPEPSTYALLAMTGLAGFIFRRQIRRVMA